MTAEQFAYWLQGFIELNGNKMPSQEQWNSIQEHLSTVFHKVTPPFNPIPWPPLYSPNPLQPGEWPPTVIC